MYSNTATLTFFRVVFPSSSASSRFSVLKKDSAQALSQQFPLRLMLLTSIGFAPREACRKAIQQYWMPRSEWNMSLPFGFLLKMAIAKASMTMVAVMSVLMDQPTTILSNRSMTTQR